MKISILGLGWFGQQLAAELADRFQILGTTRDSKKKHHLERLGYQVDELIPPAIPRDELLDTDYLLLNFPPFKDQLSWLKSWPIKKTTHVIFISSTSVYGSNSGVVSERMEPQPNTENGEILLAEEKWIRDTFSNYTIIRFGGLIGPGRHPGRYLSGRKNLSGAQSPVNLIHSGDCVGFVKQVIHQKFIGIFNLVYPDHPTRENYYSDFCKKENIPLPEFNSDSAEDKVVTDTRISSIYKFNYPIR